jgi:hypothetical protein
MLMESSSSADAGAAKRSAERAGARAKPAARIARDRIAMSGEYYTSRGFRTREWVF